MSEISLTVISLERVRSAFSADVCEWFLVLDWIIHQRVPWEENIRYIYLPSLQLSIIIWLSHLLTSFSSQMNRYLFLKYRVAHIWAERFRYGYIPWNSPSASCWLYNIYMYRNNLQTWSLMKNGHRYTEVERRQAKTDHVLQNWQTKISSINSTNTFSFQNMKKCIRKDYAFSLFYNNNNY